MIKISKNFIYKKYLLCRGKIMNLNPRTSDFSEVAMAKPQLREKRRYSDTGIYAFKNYCNASVTPTHHSHWINTKT